MFASYNSIRASLLETKADSEVKALSWRSCIDVSSMSSLVYLNIHWNLKDKISTKKLAFYCASVGLVCQRVGFLSPLSITAKASAFCFLSLINIDAAVFFLRFVFGKFFNSNISYQYCMIVWFPVPTSSITMIGCCLATPCFENASISNLASCEFGLGTNGIFVRVFLWLKKIIPNSLLKNIYWNASILESTLLGEIGND